MAILAVKNLGISFGGLRAVDKFEINIEQNELVGLIGPNGAGKTTIFNLLTGVYDATDGEILLNGKNTKGKKPSDIVMLGSSRTFQNIRLFKDMTVLDNIKIAYHNRMSYGLLGSIFNTNKYRKEEAKAYKVALDLLKVFDLDSYKNNLAKNLMVNKENLK
jgi:branched-chain amino acid transport system ATP-binding protein